MRAENNDFSALASALDQTSHRFIDPAEDPFDRPTTALVSFGIMVWMEGICIIPEKMAGAVQLFKNTKKQIPYPFAKVMISGGLL